MHPISSVTAAGETMITSIGAGPAGTTVTFALPVISPAAAVTPVVPAPVAVKRPVASIVPTLSLSTDQVTGISSIGSPYWSRQSAVNCSLSPMVSMTSIGESVMLVRTGPVGRTVTAAVPTMPEADAITVTVPGESAVKSPAESIVPTLSFVQDQAATIGISSPY
ncbi:hypothetical protein DSECCO2_625910 [anaerobic digester metagenome]